MEVRLEIGMPPSLVRGEKQVWKKYTQLAAPLSEWEDKLEGLNDFALKWERERVGGEEGKRESTTTKSTSGFALMEFDIEGAPFLKPVINTVRGKYGAEEKKEHNYKQPPAAPHALQTSRLWSLSRAEEPLFPKIL